MLHDKVGKGFFDLSSHVRKEIPNGSGPYVAEVIGGFRAGEDPMTKWKSIARRRSAE
jgi:hypothetical protein